MSGARDDTLLSPGETSPSTCAMEAGVWTRFLEKYLHPADIRINGQRPFDLALHNPGMARRTICRGSLGLGESYMDGWWDCNQLDEFFYRLLTTNASTPLPGIWADAKANASAF